MHLLSCSFAALLAVSLLCSCSANDGAPTALAGEVAGEPVDIEVVAGSVTRLRITDCSVAAAVVGELVAGTQLVPVPIPEGGLLCGWLGAENSANATFSLQVEMGSDMSTTGIPGYQTVPAAALERRGGISQIQVDADGRGMTSVDFRVFLPDANIMLVQHVRGGGQPLSPERALEIVDALVEI